MLIGFAFCCVVSEPLRKYFFAKRVRICKLQRSAVIELGCLLTRPVEITIDRPRCKPKALLIDYNVTPGEGNRRMWKDAGPADMSFFGGKLRRCCWWSRGESTPQGNVHVANRHKRLGIWLPANWILLTKCLITTLYSHHINLTYKVVR